MKDGEGMKDREGMKPEESRGLRIDLEGLAKVHQARGRRVAAVDGIRLRVEPGELLVLLGPSGCGKSTLLDLLAGLESPTAGEIRFDGEIVASPARGILLSPKERKVAMVFQGYALYPHLTVGENIAFPLRAGHAPSATIGPAVRAAAEAVEIGNLLEARPAELSGGQRQRVAIARALVRQPSLFLMDEPLSNLDARLRSATRLRIKSLQRSLGVTMVYVTHDQQEAMVLGDRVAVLKAGRIEQIGTPGELFAKPATAFVARFTGTPPMNLLRVRRRDGAEGIRLEIPAASWSCALPAGMEAALPAGETFLLGFRPEHSILLPADGERGLPVRVEGREPFGLGALAHLTAAGITLTALIKEGAPSWERAAAREATAVREEEARLDFDWDRVRFFPDDWDEA